MKFVCVFAGFAMLLTALSGAAAERRPREKTDGSSLVIRRSEHSRIEKPATQKPHIVTGNVTEVFHQPKGRELTPLPHKPALRQPNRRVTGSGHDPTPYRVGPRPKSQDRSILRKPFYHRSPVPKPQKEAAY